jgi:hypothetical protein
MGALAVAPPHAVRVRIAARAVRVVRSLRMLIGILQRLVSEK